MYNKLFTKILDSSIWLEPNHVRLVWITFLAVMDQDGIVALSGVGNVANRARVNEEEAADAIRSLESADYHNPDQENDGRRIERVPGVGWFVLNAAKYRDVIKSETAREANRERVAKHRMLKKAVIEQSECDCCGEPFEEPYSKYVVLDHHHASGRLRAYICQSCNNVVGRIELGKRRLNDAKAKLAREYIARHAAALTNGNGLVMPSDHYQKQIRSEAETDHQSIDNATLGFSEELRGWITKLTDKLPDVNPKVVEVGVLQTWIRRGESPSPPLIKSYKYFLPEIQAVGAGLVSDEQMTGVLQRRRQQVRDVSEV